MLPSSTHPNSVSLTKNGKGEAKRKKERKRSREMKSSEEERVARLPELGKRRRDSEGKEGRLSWNLGSHFSPKVTLRWTAERGGHMKALQVGKAKGDSLGLEDKALLPHFFAYTICLATSNFFKKKKLRAESSSRHVKRLGYKTFDLNHWM